MTKVKLIYSSYMIANISFSLISCKKCGVCARHVDVACKAHSASRFESHNMPSNLLLPRRGSQLKVKSLFNRHQVYIITRRLCAFGCVLLMISINIRMSTFRFI